MASLTMFIFRHLKAQLYLPLLVSLSPPTTYIHRLPVCVVVGIGPASKRNILGELGTAYWLA